MIRKGSGRGGNRRAEESIGSVIGVGTKITGNIVFAGGLRIDGEVKGNVSAAGDESARLIVGEHGRIEGECRIARMAINGTVVGQIFANESLELLPQARVTGDIRYAAAEMYPGAVVHGRLMPDAAVGKAEEQTLAEAAVANRS